MASLVKIVIMLTLISAIDWMLLLRPGAILAKWSFDVRQDVVGYIIEKAVLNDLVFLGDDHKNDEILATISKLIVNLDRTGVTHLALEISSDQQVAIDKYLSTGTGLEQIKIHSQIDCEHYRDLFKLLRPIDAATRVNIVAIDLPGSQYQGTVSRDEYMARSLLSIYESQPDAKIIVFVGNNHVLKELDWEKPSLSAHRSIREYLSAKKLRLNMFSIVQVAKKSASPCDFYHKFHSTSGEVAIDLIPQFRGWRLGMLSNMAINSDAANELLDGVIVY